MERLRQVYFEFGASLDYMEIPFSKPLNKGKQDKENSRIQKRIMTRNGINREQMGTEEGRVSRMPYTHPGNNTTKPAVDTTTTC